MPTSRFATGVDMYLCAWGLYGDGWGELDTTPKPLSPGLDALHTKATQLGPGIRLCHDQTISNYLLLLLLLVLLLCCFVYHQYPAPVVEASAIQNSQCYVATEFDVTTDNDDGADEKLKEVNI